MGIESQTAKETVKNLKKQVKHLDQMLATMREQVQDARAKGPAYQHELIRSRESTAARVATHRKMITSAKNHCKKRKREIDEWKLWYSGNEKADKSAELAQLNQEIEWRAADIAAKEAEISALYTELLVAEGEYEQLSLQLDALNALSDSDPVDADPRIQHLLEERKTLTAQLNKKN